MAPSSTKPCLSRLPLDILLYISRFVGLIDNLSVSMICRATHALLSERTFWISALQNERLIRPIACPNHEDLTLHDLQSLRRMALHTLRLRHNWTSEKPRIIGKIKTLNLGLPSHDCIFRIPGTELYIFNCPLRGIELWHLGWQRMVGKPIRSAPRIFDVSSGIDLPGKFMLAFLAMPFEMRYEVFVVCVEYGPTDAAIKLILQHEYVGRRHWGLYLDKDFVGTLCHDLHSDNLCLITLNLSTREEIFIRTDLPSVEAPLTTDQIHGSGTILVDGDLCILTVDPCGKAWIFRVPRGRLFRSISPSSPSDNNTTYSFQSNFTLFEGYRQNRGDGHREAMTVTTTTTYGVQAMTIDTPNTPDGGSNPVFTDVIFWAQPEYKHIPLVPLVLPNGMPGSLLSTSESNFWVPMFQTFSGKYGVIMSNVAEEGSVGKQILRLLRCDQEATTAVTYRDLTLPDSYNGSRIHGLSIDDHLGVLSLINSDGILHAIPYA